MKYKKPNILLIDFPKNCNDELLKSNFNIKIGTFGKPYKVPKSDNYFSVYGKSFLPDYNEQEIVFIDLTSPEIVSQPEGEKETSNGEPDWWAKCSRGFIDPRPRYMSNVQQSFYRIFVNGGIIVVFAQPRVIQDISLSYTTRYKELYHKNIIPHDNWSFLSLFSYNNFEIEKHEGKEAKLDENIHPLFQFINKYIEQISYNMTINNFRGYQDYALLPILINKYNNCIGGLIDSKVHSGKILILPQFVKKEEIIFTLLNEIFTEISPHLFPDFEGSKWIERDEYEIDSIKEIKYEIEQIKKNKDDEINLLLNKISEERVKYGFLHGILYQTGDALAKSVEMCLKMIGFKNIFNMDEKIKEVNPDAPKQEDLQIHDRSPLLVVEIKGHSQQPRESATFQIVKYINRRMSEYNRTDIQGICIINHQRNLPCLERDNDNVFTPQQIKDSLLSNFTLLTTWDLYILIKGLNKWRWPLTSIQKLFYKTGRMQKYPTIYRPIGEIVHYYDNINVVSIKITSEILRKSDRIAYALPSSFEEENITSMQIDTIVVDEARPDQTVGLKTIYGKELLKTGTIVFKIIEEPKI
jgi:hypothetical protein